jgi:hypothetical protein
LSTVIVRTAHENFFPRLAMGRLEIVAFGKLLDLLRRQRSEQILHEFAQKRVPQPVNSFKMFEEQNQTLEMRGLEFAIHAVKRMGDGVGDSSALQITLQRKNIVADERDVGVLLFGNAPGEKVNLAGVLRKISRDLFADESVRQITNLQAAIDRVVIGDCHKIHSAFDELAMQLARIGIRIGKIKSPKEPFLGTRAEAGVNMKITFAHI